MKRRHVLAHVATFTLLPGVVTTVAHADDSLYRDLGGKEKIAAFTDDFVERLRADERIKARFTDANIPRLKRMLTDQFCMLAGGPVEYNGRTMAEAHSSMGIHNAEFNALAEDLQLAMDAAGISFFTQNRLIALLAPMQRDVVTK